MKSKKRAISIGIIIAVIIVAIAIALNAHTCEECGKTFIGKEYKITWFDQSETACKECYSDFYSF